MIPKSLRDRLGLSPGSEVTFVLDEDGEALRVVPVRERPTLRGALAGLDLVAELEREHWAEVRR